MTTLLPISFFILKYIGLWQPVHWNSRWKIYFYKIFTIFSVIILYVDTGSQIVDAFEVCKTIADYADHSFILLTMIGICIKMASIIKNRKDIVDLINKLQSGSFQSRNSLEDQVLNDFENLMK